MTDRYEEHRLGDANLIRCRDCRALVLDVDVHDAHHEGDALCGLPWDSLLEQGFYVQQIDGSSGVNSNRNEDTP